LAVTNSSSTPVGFVDGNKSGNDYAYDENGNLITDNNKGLAINYNYLNLPSSVSSSSQGKTITYTYDATGKKLKKSFPGQADHYYMDGVEYDGSTLLFAMTEEGRVRPKTDGTYTYDYFLKDHLGNVRVVLTTDNSQSAAIYPAATMETATAATETTYYSNLDKVRNFRPQGFTTLQSNNEKVALLKGADPNKQVGPSITIKVNSGDTISLTAQSFYPEGSESRRNGLSETALGQLMSALIAPTGLNAQGKALATDALRAQAFGSSSSYQNVMGQLPSSDYGKENNRPKAYMVWMLFDKEMKMVKTGRSSGATQIQEGAGQVKSMAENNIVMDQGGFLTAYTVSQSPSSVYIDNFQLTQTTGQVMEMNDYYPFGMLNNGLSNPGTTSPLNNYKYNGKELQNELNLAWLDYGARFYDPQIGRWHTPDPMAEKAPNWSPYVYCNNSPVVMTDPDGRYSRVGAWIRNIIWGGNGISKADKEWGVNLSGTSLDGVAEIVFQTKGSKHWFRDDYIAAWEANNDFAQTLEESGIEFTYTNDINKARLSHLKAASGLFLANPILKGVTNTVNAGSEVAEAGAQEFQSVGAAAAGFSKKIIPEGFKEVKQFGYLHGQKVYEYMGKYFSKDIDGHNGGIWKVFEAVGGKLKRIGTADETLTIFKK
jgi:RHS repeat-associated protein